MPVLTVLLPPDAPVVGTEFSHVLAGPAQDVLQHGAAPLALLPAADRLHLVVPASRLSWHALRLPPMASGRLRQALDGLLEDRLLDEPAQLALAVAPQRSGDGTSLVAACDRDWLVACLAAFEQARRTVVRVLPEFAPQPGATVPQLHVTGTPDDAWVCVVGADSCVRVPLEDAGELIALPLVRDAAQQPLPSVFAEPEVAARAEALFQSPVEVLPQAERLLASSQGGWELAQFDLALRGGGRLARRWAQGWQQFSHAPVWRPLRWGVGLLLLTNLVGINAWAWQQQRELRAREAQVKTVFTQAFPRVRTVVDAPLQMARELQLLRQGSGAVAAGDLELMLGALGAALPADQTPTALEYAGGELRAEGLKLEAAAFTELGARLQGAGLEARQDGGRLSLRVATAPTAPRTAAP